MAQMNQARYGVSPSVCTPLPLPQRSELMSAECETLVADERTWGYHPRTVCNYRRVNALYEDYIATMFATVHDGWLASHPVHVTLFLRNYLQPILIGRGGGEVASSTLQTYVSSLSRCFADRGRTRPWCGETESGNPVQSDVVRAFIRSYRQRQLADGVRECSAVPMQPQDFATLSYNMRTAMAHSVRENDAQNISLLLRDLTHMACMWHNGRRGHDVLHMDWEDVHVCEPGEPAQAVTHIWAGEICHDTPPPHSLLISISRTKTEWSRRPQSWEYVSHDDPNACAVRHLRLLYQWVHQLTKTTPSGPVFVALRGEPRRLSAEAAGRRVRANILKFGVDHGETMHSFRRGHIQAAQAAGEPISSTMRRVGIATVSTFDRYADKGRHLA